jgi:succinate dehydrogenase / fumarate reductase cytochrome b subunit
MNKYELYKKRPLSPHLSIYKPQLSSGLSIFHRITGFGLYFAILILSWTFILSDKSTYKQDLCINCNLIKLFIGAVCFGISYHLCTGIRHLFWDFGVGYEVSTADKTSYLCILTALSLTSFLCYSIFF